MRDDVGYNWIRIETRSKIWYKRVKDKENITQNRESQSRGLEVSTIFQQQPKIDLKETWRPEAKRIRTCEVLTIMS